MISAIDVAQVRKALADLPEGTSYGAPPRPELVYLPRSHLKAMDPNCLLVTGMRGAGKTFWWSALQNGTVRLMLARQTVLGAFSDKTEVRIGFGVGREPSDCPNKEVLRELMGKGVEPRLIWRAVVAWQVAPDSHCLRHHNSWSTRVEYVRGNPEPIDHLFEARDKELHDEEIFCLILFDALDRCADDWRGMYSAVRGLMQTAADMRAYRRLRLKLFLRSDQVNRARSADFPDASKVLSSAVELSWPRHELYGLLWHSLANGRNGDVLRDFLGNGDWSQERIGGLCVHAVPRRLIFEETVQRDKFHDMSGPWMGREPKRGIPYSWITNRLSDTEGRVSPRAFLGALRRAASETADGHPQHRTALHHDCIKRGVHEASKVRVHELQDDYPWVNRVLGPLRGMVVPCEAGEIAERWRSEGVLEGLAREAVEGEVKLPPRHIDKGAEGILEDLESLRVLMRLRDGRVTIPDVFRVTYGLGRMGGVKPVRRENRQTRSGARDHRSR